jgi:predicted enzyme related to lactoylglutathione lyase
MGEMEGGDEVYGAHWKQGSDLAIVDHSKVTGKNRQPERYMINFEVDDIEKEVARMKKNKVKLVTDIYHVENYGRIATFEDIEGNYFQFVQVRPNKK